jgi:carboxyl-terminal processing protease
LELTKTFYKEILDDEFEFKAKEFVEMDPEKVDYAKDEADLKENWRKVLKYEVLTRIVEQEETQEKAIANKDTSIKIKTFAEIEKDAREKVKKRYDEMFHRIDKLDNDDRFADYINALTEVYDPHTNYFPPKDKEDFDINMSGSLEGIGAQLSQRDEYIRVERIIPGSPSWKNGELKEGDVILKVAQGSDEPVDVVDMRLDDAVRLIRGKKGTEVRLTIKKTDGTIKKITLIRDVIKLEETFAKSAVLNPSGGNGEIGYIKLPSFYADFNDKGGRRSSYDMKQELIKLKNENISGLIIDLRDNGGGSLDDVVDIAGYFIDRGPVVQVHSRNENPYIREDYDPNVYWDGPLVVLVNKFSASASEILAAALQDYEKAVIVGSTHSFGKGTVQTMLDLDNSIPPTYSGMKPFGAIKLTIQKFYRIDGGTTQLQGVIPDIILPDAYTHSELGEKDLDYPLAWSNIEPAQYTQYKANEPAMRKVVSLAKDRITLDTNFTKIENYTLRLKELRDKTSVSLNMEDYKSDRKSREEEAKKLTDLGKKELDFNISSLKADIPALESDTTQTNRVKTWHGDLKKDIYLNEAINVIRDWSSFNGNKK